MKKSLVKLRYFYYFTSKLNINKQKKNFKLNELYEIESNITQNKSSLKKGIPQKDIDIQDFEKTVPKN